LGLHVPFTQAPVQQSEVLVHTPPIGTHFVPDGTHVPFWHTPPVQQSESDVHVPLPVGMHEAAHWKTPPIGTQTWLQQLSQSSHGWPAG
jgi:hypothetical protein